MNDVSFIKFKGRIIPINKNRRKRVKHGVALSTSGLALASIGAYTSGKLMNKAKRFRQEGFVGARNIKASHSRKVSLKDFRMRHNKSGRIVGMGGKFKNFKGQTSMFDEMADEAGKSFSNSKRKKSITNAFRGRRIFSKTNLLASILVGAGVERIIAGYEKDNESITAYSVRDKVATASSFVTYNLADRVRGKITKGSPIMAGLKSDAVKGFSKISKMFLKKKFRF